MSEAPDKRDRLDLICDLVETRKKLFDVTELSERYRAALEKIASYTKDSHIQPVLIAREALHTTEGGEK